MDVALENAPGKGAAEGATRAGRRTRANLSGKRTEFEGWTAIRIHMAGGQP